jgi:hypothetical protein
MQASLRLRSGITVFLRWQCRPRYGYAVASQRLHAGNAGLASASQWHRSVFTLAMQGSLRLRSGMVVPSRQQRWPRYGYAVASQCLHAGNAGLASASQWHRSVFTLAMQASLRLRSGVAACHAGNADLASASQWLRRVITLAIQV